VAEDRRFELLRGCPQHAFQQCASAFCQAGAVRDLGGPWPLGPGGRPRIPASETTNETVAEVRGMTPASLLARPAGGVRRGRRRRVLGCGAVCFAGGGGQGVRPAPVQPGAGAGGVADRAVRPGVLPGTGRRGRFARLGCGRRAARRAWFLRAEPGKDRAARVRRRLKPLKHSPARQPAPPVALAPAPAAAALGCRPGESARHGCEGNSTGSASKIVRRDSWR